MSDARNVIADYLAKHVFVNEGCAEPGCELPDETGPCQRTCAMYRIDCLGHADAISAAIRAAAKPTGEV